MTQELVCYFNGDVTRAPSSSTPTREERYAPLVVHGTSETRASEVDGG